MNTLPPSSLPGRLHAAVLLLLVALGVFMAPPITAHAADGDDNWTVRTASNDFGAERTSFSYALDPGASISDALVVANHGTTSLDLGVYAADGYTTDSGQFDLVVGGAESVSVGAWVHSDEDRVTVGPGETVEVPYTVSVPANATPGDYSGGIVTSLVQPDDTNEINVDRRLGIRVALRVGGELKPTLAIENMNVNWAGGLNPFSGGDASVTYTVHNTGNAVLSAQQAAGVTGPFGWLASTANAVEAPPQLLPGESWDVSVPVKDVAAAVWLAATATVTPVVVDASGSTTALEPVTATANGWAIPWMLILIVVAVIGFAVLAVLLRRRHRVRQRAREDARVREAVEIALGKTEAEAEVQSPSPV